jgi:hypothetical protein
MKLKNILNGCVSPETAFVVADYPYGFRLRCKIRYWLEHNPKRGTRFVSQTTNPKLSAIQDIWNKPKASTYADVAGAMFTDENGHVQWSALSYYPGADECAAWLNEYRVGIPAEVAARVDKLIDQKRVYERAKATGMDYRYAGLVSSLVSGKVLPYEEALARVNRGIQQAAAAAAQNNILEISAATVLADKYQSQCSDESGAVESAS